MATKYCKSGSGVTEFAQSTAYSVGDRIVPARSDTGTNYLVARRYVWKCTTAGTTAAANPTWSGSYTPGSSTVTSGTAVFTCCNPGYDTAGTADWTYATPFLPYACNSSPAGDIIYVSNNHAETWSTAYATFASANTRIHVVCVNDSAMPPTATATTATVTTTGNTALAAGFDTNCYVYGITFSAGDSTGTASLTVSGYIGNNVYENCNFILGGSGSSSRITALATNRNKNYFINCGFKFGHASQYIESSGIAELINCSVLSGGTSPTFIFAPNASMSNLKVVGFDASNCSAGVMLLGNMNNQYGALANFSGCKMPTSWSGGLHTAVPVQGGRAESFASDDTNELICYVVDYRGTQSVETSIVRTGGATDGTTQLSWRLASSVNAIFPASPFPSVEIAIANETTGSSKTATIYVAHDGATAFKNDEVWAEFSYFSESGSPLMATVSTRKATYLTTAASYTSAGTWPNATGTGPNGSSTWNLFKLTSPSFTPQKKGYILAKVFLGIASKTVFVDPLIVVA